jgi:hypothetical protein
MPPPGGSRFPPTPKPNDHYQWNDLTNCSCVVPGPEYYQSGVQEPNPLADSKDADNVRIAITWHKVRLC